MSGPSDTEVADRVLEALGRAVDRRALAAALAPLGLGQERASSPSVSETASRRTAPGKTEARVLERIVLGDILDESILSSRPGETSYPLRVLFGALGEGLEGDTAFALANGLNFYFRVAMDDEPKLALGLEVSRLYYRFAEERPLEAELVRPLSPLLARLMSTELEHVRLEAVDGAAMFDSGLHERALGSDATNPRIRAPKSFLCRVVSNGRVRVKARVQT